MTDQPTRCQYMWARERANGPTHQCRNDARYGERLCYQHLKYRNAPIIDNGCKQSRRLMGKK